MKKILILALLLVVAAAPLCAQSGYAQDRNFTAKSRFYVYAMGSAFHLTDEGAGFSGYSGNGETNMILSAGAGFSLINLGSRFFLNLEADYSGFSIGNSGVDSRDFRSLSLLVAGEYRLTSRSPVSVYGGIGLAIISKSGFVFRSYDGLDWLMDEDNDTPMILEFGLKATITRHLMFRGAVRFYSLSEDEGDYGFWEGLWYDYWEYYDFEYDNRLYATSISVGLELHF